MVEESFVWVVGRKTERELDVAGHETETEKELETSWGWGLEIA